MAKNNSTKDPINNKDFNKATDVSYEMVNNGSSQPIELNRDLNKATNLGIASIVGAIIPIIGLLLAIIALMITSNVPGDKFTVRKKRTASTIATFGIILSLLAGAGYYTYYRSVQKAAETERQNKILAEKQAQEAAESKKRLNEQLLNGCLKKADDNYWDYIKLNATSTRTEPDGTTTYRAYQWVWDRAESNRTTAKNECYRLYPNN